MKRSTFRGAAAAVIAVAAVSASAVLVPPAQAASGYAPVIGTAVGTVNPTPTNVPVSLRTSAPCPAGTGVIIGFWESTDPAIPAASRVPAGSISISANTTDIANVSTSGIPLSNSLVNLAGDAGRVLVNGVYDLQIVCYDDPFVQTPLGQFDASFTVSGGTAGGAGTTATFAVAQAPASTTVLTVSPASPQVLGTSVTLTATVTSTAPVAGNVVFRSGTTVVGPAAGVAVSGGAATLATTALPAGPQSLTAEFVPAAGANVAGSTSAPVPYTVTAPAQATTTTLASGPANPTTADVLTLTATVAAGSTPANGGQVVFSEVGGGQVGTATVSGGTAAISVTGLAAGTKTYRAAYQGNAQFLASTSADVSVTVTAFAGVTASEEITAVVDAGALTITAGGVVPLGTLALNPAATLLVSTPRDMNDVTVTDTRAGNLGWFVNGQLSDFSSSNGAKINAANLGWTPKVVSQLPVQAVTAGPAVAPGNGIAVGSVTTEGLASARRLATAAAGGSVGTAVLNATLRLQAPTSTTPGTYSATLTLTAL